MSLTGKCGNKRVKRALPENSICGMQPPTMLQQLFNKAFVTDSLMDQLVEAANELRTAESNASYMASKTKKIASTYDSCLKDLTTFKLLLSQEQKELLKLQGIHKICLFEESNNMTDRARRLKQRNCLKETDTQLYFTATQIEKEIEETHLLTREANERCADREKALVDYSVKLEKCKSEQNLLKVTLENVRAQVQNLKALHNKCKSRVSAEILPENLLLHIFQYLSKKELMLRVGPVCKTWRRVSKDRTLWKNEIVTLRPARFLPWDENIRFLRIAPCLKSLTLHFPDSQYKVLDRELLKCQCQLSSLEVYLKTEEHFESFLILLKGQQHLEKLSIVEVLPAKAGLKRCDANLLWNVIGQMKKLKILSVRNSNTLLRSKCGVQMLPNLALEEIHINKCYVRHRGALEVLVKSSSSSLRELELPPDVNGSVVGGLALQDCINLKVLRVPCVSELVGIESCSHLEVLKIISLCPPSSAVIAVLAFLKTWPAVKKLQSFEVSCSGSACCDQLVQAIAYMPMLKELRLHGPTEHLIKDMPSLLPSVPLLEVLDSSIFPLSKADLEPFLSGCLPALKVLNIPTAFENYMNFHHCLLELLNSRKGLSLTGVDLSDKCYCSDCSIDSDSEASSDDDFY